MKYLLLIAIALVVFWWLRNHRGGGAADARESATPARARTGAPALPTEIVACAVCQLHLPRGEALPGPGGVYCSEAHRRQAGG